jgi:NAD-dependent dihydropyrimidine dehydrogenase PreA subunit
MPVLVNFKICDNSKDCGGICECPTGAFYWDEQKNTIAINEKMCIQCGTCEQACPVGAIKVAHTQEEYLKIKQEFDEDLRKITDLFVDRYGAQPIHEAFLGEQKKFNSQVLEATRLIVVEMFNNESIHCLVNSIPVQELLKDIKRDLTYLKMEITDNSMFKVYGISTLPALLFFKSGKLLGKIEGYYDASKKIELINKIRNITSED